jgi:hypothetical protein
MEHPLRSLDSAAEFAYWPAVASAAEVGWVHASMG